MTPECPKCHTPMPVWVMCPACHAAEAARVHARDTPTTPEVPVAHYQPPPERCVRPNADGRRVFRHEQAQG